jgi:hypothetical protein
MSDIKVKLEFSWNFNKRDWNNKKKHFNELKSELETKADYDPISMFFFLNDMVRPDLEHIDVTPT